MQLTYYLLSIFYIPLILCRFDKRIKLSSHMDEFGIKLSYSYMLPTHANLLYTISSATYKSSSCSNNVMIWLRRGLFWYHLLTARIVSTSTTQLMQTLLPWCQPQVWNYLLNWDVTDDEAHAMSSGTQFIMDPHIRTNPFVLNLMDRLAALENSFNKQISGGYSFDRNPVWESHRTWGRCHGTWGTFHWRKVTKYR